MITYKQVKIAVAAWAIAVYLFTALFGWPHMPVSFNHGAKLQSLMRVIN